MTTMMAPLLLLLVATSAMAQYNTSMMYDPAVYYDRFHEDNCGDDVPEGLTVPSMCFLYEAVGECTDMGFDPHQIEEYKECLLQILPAEEAEFLEQEWNSDFGPGGAAINEICGSMGYDISMLNHYAVCLEHLFGVGYDSTNEAFLGVEIVDEVPYIDWYNYFEYDPDYTYGPDLPDDPTQRIFALLHGIAVSFLPGYNMCGGDEYMCSDRSCLPLYWQCDGMNDCQDGTDELFCGNQGWYDYEDPWYTCNIADWEWCDGWQDCAYDEDYWCDYSDDYDWYSDYGTWYECAIDEDAWCDGYHDCAFDEADWCTAYDWNNWDEYENDPWFQCNISDYQWCDGVQDCAFDEDTFCNDYGTYWDGWYSSSLDDDWYSSSDDGWYACEIEEDQWCNGIKDCAFDEANWCDKFDWDNWETYETQEYFQCNLLDDQWCDGIQDCAFDESNFCDYYY